MAYEKEYRIILKDVNQFTIDLYNIFNVRVIKKLNQMASFSFVGYSLTSSEKSFLFEGNEVIIIYNNKKILKGLIRERSIDEESDEWTISGDDTSVKLFNRELQDRTEWLNTAANTIVSSLISGIMDAGTIEAADIISFRAEYGNVLDRLVQVAKITNYDWYISQGIMPTYIDAFNFVAYRGQVTPAVENFKIGTDLGEIVREKDFDRIANVIAVMGWGDGPLQFKSKIEACTTNLTYLSEAITSTQVTILVNDTSLFPASGNIWIGMEKISYASKTALAFFGCIRGVSGGIKAYAHSDNILVRDAQYTSAAPQTGSSIEVNGIKQKTFPQLDIIDQDTLDRLAQRLIGEYKDSVENGWAVISGDDFTTAVDLGDTISIEERDTTDKTNYRLLGIEYNSEVLEIIIEFGTVKDYFLEDLARMKKELAINNVYGAGAPNIDESLMTDNVEYGFPLYHPFKIPDNAIAVGELMLDLDLYQFRDYSKVTGTESSAHTHSTPLVNYSSGDVYLAGLQANVDIVKNSGFAPTTFGTNANTANHTHNSEYGIQEDTTVLANIQLELWLDGFQLTDTNTPDLTSVTGWEAGDYLTGHSYYYGADISKTTLVTKWTPGQRYVLEVRPKNVAAHRCKLISKLSKTAFIKGINKTE